MGTYYFTFELLGLSLVLHLMKILVRFTGALCIPISVIVYRLIFTKLLITLFPTLEMNSLDLLCLHYQNNKTDWLLQVVLCLVNNC